MTTKTYTVRSVEETWQAAAEVAGLLRPGLVVALHGDLGAGKTTFVQGLGWALGLRRPVTSPTFTVCTEHVTREFKLVHMDLYRLSGPDDLLAIGFPEYLESGAVVAVEWPERAGDLIPPDALHVRLTLTDDPDTRVIRVADHAGDAAGSP
jgi:tRNA threonylcarbamoyladenosine biosynthesis protein TsaE